MRAKITVVLERLDNLGAVMIFTKLVASPPNLSRASDPEKSDARDPSPPLAIDAFRLVELTDRTSAVMQASETDDSLRSDPLSALYATFTSINGVPLKSTSLKIVSCPLFAANIGKKARETLSVSLHGFSAHHNLIGSFSDSQDLIVVPWTLGKADAAGLVASMRAFLVPALSTRPS